MPTSKACLDFDSPEVEGGQARGFKKPQRGALGPTVRLRGWGYARLDCPQEGGQGVAGLMCPQEEESPCGEGTLKRDRSFSEHDLVQLRSEVTSGLQPAPQPPGGLELSRPRAGSMQSWRPSPLEPGT